MIDALMGTSGACILGTALIGCGLYEAYTTEHQEIAPIGDMLLVSLGILFVHESKSGNDLMGSLSNITQKRLGIPGVK